MNKKTKNEKIENLDPTLENQENTSSNEDNNLEAENLENKAEEPKSNDGDSRQVAYAEKMSALEDKHMRLMAEFENFKRRTAREKLLLKDLGKKDTLSALLPVLDDFDRAKNNADNDTTEEFFTEGVELVYQKFQAFLQQQKIEIIDTQQGTPFNVDLHEAITKIPAPSEELKGKILDTVEKGYKINDIIIRYAKVVIGE